MKKSLSIFLLILLTITSGLVVQSCAGSSASSNVTITGAGN